MLSEWIGQSAISELAFCQVMRLMRSYSLLEVLEDATGYATHLVVHRWAHHHQAKRFASELGPLAVVVVGGAVLAQSNQDNLTVQRRLLPHAQTCCSWLLCYERDWDLECSRRSDLHCQGARKDQTLLLAVNCIGRLFADQSKLVEAASMQKWALQRYEEALGPDDILALQTMGYLGRVAARSRAIPPMSARWPSRQTGSWSRRHPGTRQYGCGRQQQGPVAARSKAWGLRIGQHCWHTTIWVFFTRTKTGYQKPIECSSQLFKGRKGH
jgi:hypothetical protein